MDKIDYKTFYQIEKVLEAKHGINGQTERVSIEFTSGIATPSGGIRLSVMTGTRWEWVHLANISRYAHNFDYPIRMSLVPRRYDLSESDNLFLLHNGRVKLDEETGLYTALATSPASLTGLVDTLLSLSFTRVAYTELARPRTG